MNVHVLGSDYSSEMMGVDWNVVGDTFGKIVEFAAPLLAPVVQQRMSPTQKSIIQQVTGTTSSMPLYTPPKKTFMEENGTYIMIGGAVLVGAIVLMKMRKRGSRR